MKVLLLWTVAAWVVAVTADRPCSEYCVYLSSGTRDIEFQPTCDCMYEETEFQNQLDDSSIYYEPVDYIPVPSYIHNHPFYILNPIIQGRQMYSTDIKPLIPENIQSFLNSRTYNGDIDVNVENTHSTRNREEKDIQTNSEKFTAPIYLDINLEPTNERTASTLTADELELTAQSLIECANLYAVIDSRKRADSTEVKTNPINEYSQPSNPELRKEIEKKCSHISNIIEKSRNEIKMTRPKLTRIIFRLNSDDQHQNTPRSNDSPNTDEHVLCVNTTEKEILTPVQNKDNENQISENEGQAIDIYTASNENTSDNEETLFSDISSTTAAASTSVVNIQSPYSIYSKTQGDEFTKELINQHPIIPTTNMENEYPLHRDYITFDPVTVTSNPSTSTTNIAQQGFLGNQRTDRRLNTENVQGRYENRSHYEEGEVPLVKIITHEFSNDTVQSFINGTEDIPNDDFQEETDPEVMKVMNSSNGNNNSGEILSYSQSTVPTQSEVEIGTPTTEGRNTALDVSGNLYFVFKNQQIPARFVQNLNGSLHVGIDGVTLCNTLTQNEGHNSALLTTLCNCYKHENCAQRHIKN